MPHDVCIAQCIERHRDQPGGLLPLLQAVHGALGYIPPDSVADIAVAMNLSRAEVHGVITFYHDFRSEPAGRHRVQICRAEACQAMGAAVLEARARDILGIADGETTADGSVSLQSVFCLGNCACSPSIRVDNDIYARVDAVRLESLLSGLANGGDK